MKNITKKKLVLNPYLPIFYIVIAIFEITLYYKTYLITEQNEFREMMRGISGPLSTEVNKKSLQILKEITRFTRNIKIKVIYKNYICNGHLGVADLSFKWPEIILM